MEFKMKMATFFQQVAPSEMANLDQHVEQFKDRASGFFHDAERKLYPTYTGWGVLWDAGVSLTQLHQGNSQEISIAVNEELSNPDQGDPHPVTGHYQQSWKRLAERFHSENNYLEIRIRVLSIIQQYEPDRPEAATKKSVYDRLLALVANNASSEMLTNFAESLELQCRYSYEKTLEWVIYYYKKFNASSLERVPSIIAQYNSTERREQLKFALIQRYQVQDYIRLATWTPTLQNPDIRQILREYYNEQKKILQVHQVEAILQQYKDYEVLFSKLMEMHESKEVIAEWQSRGGSRMFPPWRHANYPDKAEGPRVEQELSLPVQTIPPWIDMLLTKSNIMFESHNKTRVWFAVFDNCLCVNVATVSNVIPILTSDSVVKSSETSFTINKLSGSTPMHTITCPDGSILTDIGKLLNTHGIKNDLYTEPLEAKSEQSSNGMGGDATKPHDDGNGDGNYEDKVKQQSDNQTVNVDLNDRKTDEESLQDEQSEISSELAIEPEPESEPLPPRNYPPIPHPSKAMDFDKLIEWVITPDD